MFNNVQNPFAKRGGDEESAIEENCVYAVLGCGRIGKELSQMTRDGRIGHIGQPEFAEHALLFLLRPIRKSNRRKKAAKGKLENFVASDRSPQCSADERRACACDGHIDGSGTILSQERLFGSGALTAKRAALPQEIAFCRASTPPARKSSDRDCRRPVEDVGQRSCE